MQQIFTTCSQGTPAWKSRNRALSWRETLNNALHRSWHAELDDNMKEHLNRTACGFFNSNCYILSKQQQRSRWPHYVLLSFSMRLDEGKHFQTWRMQESGSCTARRFPMEDSLLNSYSRKEECISGICTPSSIGISWGITCITAEDWTNLIFICRGCRVLHCSNICECIQNHLFWIAPDLHFQDLCHYTLVYLQGDCFSCSLW